MENKVTSKQRKIKPNTNVQDLLSSDRLTTVNDLDTAMNVPGDVLDVLGDASRDLEGVYDVIVVTARRADDGGSIYTIVSSASDDLSLGYLERARNLIVNGPTELDSGDNEGGNVDELW